MSRLIKSLGLVCLLLSSNAMAWGWEGHKLICAIAQEQLTSDASKMVNRLLEDGKKLNKGVVPFPESCLWADNVKYSTRKGTYEHHFINVPDDAMTIDLHRDCAALNCTATAVQQALVYLGRPAESNKEISRRAAALRFLGHYIGDLHQPLHVGNASDWGGNKIKVRWNNKKSNLHAIWDYEMTDAMGLSYPKSVKFLLTLPTVSKTSSVMDWMNESLALGRSRAYVDQNGSLIKNGDSLGSEYLNHNKPIVLARLALAGKRLADLLNAIAAGEKPTAFLLSSNAYSALSESSASPE
jgi:hypothetical protein